VKQGMAEIKEKENSFFKEDFSNLKIQGRIGDRVTLSFQLIAIMNKYN